MKSIPYGRQLITEEDIEAVAQVLRSDFLTQGPAVQAFEQAFAEYVDAKEAIAVANGTLALHLSALALNVRPGQKILVTPNTFAASANCIRYCGGEVEFVDIDPRTLCMDLTRLEEKLQTSPRGAYQGVIVVDFAGYPMDLKKVREIADRYGIWIIEDACHALGAAFQNGENSWAKAGSGQYADLTVFSFHPVKHLATGEGGMITTRNSDIARKIRRLRTHGITRDRSEMTRDDGPWYYEMVELGLNARMPDILCALGLSQLKRMDENLVQRRLLAERYDQELKSLPLVIPSGAGVRHGYHLYPVQVQSDVRSRLFEYLKENGIYAQVHYIPVHQLAYYEGLYGKQIFPIADAYYSKTISLPMYHSLSEDDQGRVISAIRGFYS